MDRVHDYFPTEFQRVSIMDHLQLDANQSEYDKQLEDLKIFQTP